MGLENNCENAMRSPVLERDVFVYCKKDGTVWHVMRGTVAGRCVEVDAGFRTIVKSDAIAGALKYCKQWGDTYKGVYDANDVDIDPTQVVACAIGFC